MIVLILFAAVLGTAVGQNEDCRGIRDGTVVAWGCRTYTVCRNNKPLEVDCHSVGLVYNPVKQQCDNKLNTPPPCGLYRDCRNQRDGNYADKYTNCTAFYTCKGGKFFGHQQCNPGLIYHEEKQICDWPYNVPPPCGTKGGVPKPTSTPMKKSPKKVIRKIYGKRRFVGAKEEKPERKIRARNVHYRVNDNDVKDTKPRRSPFPFRARNNRRANKAAAKAAAQIAAQMIYKEYVHGDY